MSQRYRRLLSRSRQLETLESRTLLSASLLSAFGIDSASPYGTEVTGVGVDPAGNVVVAGMFAGAVDMDPGPGVHNITAQGSYTYDAFLAKYSKAGSLIWCKTLSSPGNDLTNGILVDGSGNILLTGNFTGTLNMDMSGGTSDVVSNGSADAFIAKYDGSGDLIWAKSFGGSGDDDVQHIVSDKNGGYIISGSFQGTADLDPGAGVKNVTAKTNWDCYVSRIDGSGNLIWANTFSAPWSVYVSNVAVDSQGNVLAAGSMQGVCDIAAGVGRTRHVGDANTMLGYVAQFNAANGAIVWVKTFGQGGQGVIMADMAVDTQDNIVLAGSFGGSADFNPGPGVKMLTEQQSPDAFTGFVMKLGPQGGFRWAGALTGDWWSDAFGVATDSHNNIYVTGEINGTNTFDITGENNDTMTSRGEDDAFLSKYDPAGHLAWAETMGSVGYDHGMHVAVGGDGTLYMSGYYNDMAHFGAVSGGVDLTALGTSDAFVAVFGQTPVMPAVLALTLLQPNVRQARTRDLTATLTLPQGVVTGWVTFMDGERVVGRARVEGGVARLRVRGLSLGAHALTAVYEGDEDFSGVTSDAIGVHVVGG